MNKIIIFTRIAKTGSTSICHGFPMSTMPRPEEILKRYKTQIMMDKGKTMAYTPSYLDGHHPYGIHKIYRAKRVSYFTFLREPVDRWLSSFYYCRDKRTKTENVLMAIYKKASSSLAFLDRCIELGINDNVMVRQLSGIENINNIISGVYTPYCCLNREPYTSDDKKRFFEEAKESISSRYDFVGLFEDIESEFKRLVTFYGFNPEKAKLPSEKRRATERGSYIDMDDVRIKRRVEELNKFDTQLYNFHLERIGK